jgi:hypothetical protein
MTGNTLLDAERSKDAAVGSRQAVGPWSNLALHTIGWRAFQDLSTQICEVTLSRTVEIFREAQDGGQDAVFLISGEGASTDAIGTVQCKHCSDPRRKLRLSDLNAELDTVKALVENGLAESYILMTNMSVDAPVAAELRRTLRDQGVRRPHILGMQYLTRAIRSSPKLRALVPQVYGLGDLTSILDERLTRQSRALLDDWVPKLKTYVPTRAHRAAVRAQAKHGIVLLLGNPSSGKSAIGAILSTIASEDPNHTVLALTSPRDFEAGWNPDDPGRFFWIDDAFGSNVLRDDYVQDWSSTFKKVQAAIAKGNRFLLTSRKHIYEAARRKLGQRNLPAFIDESAIVDVGVLSFEEKQQILYNHVNFGGQSQSWRNAVKPFLEAVARVPDFLPGISERLGNPAFTKSLAMRNETLVRFMQEPTEHLIDTINALEPVCQAALILVYVHQGAFDELTPDAAAVEAVTSATGASLPQIMESIADLKGSFLRQGAREERIWRFAHPTIADALTEILRAKSHMGPALLRGATIETVLSGFYCEGIRPVRDALPVPETLNAQLIQRLLETPTDLFAGWSLFSFLARRASEDILRMIYAADQSLLSRRTWPASRIYDEPRWELYARLHEIGVLSEGDREVAAQAIEFAASQNLDLSFFEDETLMALIPPRRLVKLGALLRSQSLPNIADHITEISEQADLDDDPGSNFDDVQSTLLHIESIVDDQEAHGLIDDARSQIGFEVIDIERRQEQRDSERAKENEEDSWSLVSTVGKEKPIDEPVVKSSPDPRSVFDDIDRN